MINQAKKLLESIGAELNTTPCGILSNVYQYALATRLGPLFITLSKDKTKKTISAFCRFYDPACLKAFKLTGNQNSGKWNHYFMDSIEFKNFVKQCEGFKS